MARQPFIAVHSQNIDALQSDVADMPAASWSSALYIETAGTIKYTTVEGDVDQITVAALSYHPLAIKKLWDTGTSVTGVHSLK